MANKQLNVNVNQSFVQTVVNMILLKEFRILPRQFSHRIRPLT